VSQSTSDDRTLVDVDSLRDVIVRALRSAGATSSDARAQAEMLVEAELREQPSHGLLRLPALVTRLRAGLLRSGVTPTLSWKTDAALSVDGARAFGPVVGNLAVDEMIARVGRTGIVVGTVSNAGHLGMLAPYVERLAAAGCVGMAFTVSEALVHPWGSSRALVGTNPLGISVPTAGDPIVLDMSTAASSAGRILDYASRGQSIPSGWAVDAEGNPTTDAAAAADGAISPFGGAKGYALGVTLGAMVGVLSGSSFGSDVHGTLDTTLPVSKGDLFLALSVDLLGGTSHLAPLSRYLDEVRASGADGQAVAIPGDRARSSRRRLAALGIRIDSRLWARAEQLARGER
jgi:L-2-hydroxycarboxylate dehydrogenase (NAD+)